MRLLSDELKVEISQSNHLVAANTIDGMVQSPASNKWPYSRKKCFPQILKNQHHLNKLSSFHSHFSLGSLNLSHRIRLKFRLH